MNDPVADPGFSRRDGHANLKGLLTHYFGHDSRKPPAREKKLD